MSLNINVLVTAREEYITELLKILMPYFKDNFKRLLQNSQRMPMLTYKLRPFQESIRDIQRWNEVTIDNRVKELTNQYPYFGDLLKAIFVINVKILSCVKTNPKGKGIKIEIPNIPIFIHKLFIEIARKLYYKPQIILGDDDNLELVIENAIYEVLRRQIPIQQILQEYLMDTFDDSEEEEQESEDTEPEEPEEHDYSNVHEETREIQPDNQPDNVCNIQPTVQEQSNQQEETNYQETRPLEPPPVVEPSVQPPPMQQPPPIHAPSSPPPSQFEEPRRPVLFEDAKTF